MIRRRRRLLLASLLLTLASGLRLVDKPLLVAGPPERLHIWTLGSVEDLTVGGEE